MLPLTILLSSCVGAAIGLGMMVFKRHGRNVPIPFGPYLAIAGLIALYWGKPLTHAYLGTTL
jgi:leader peptidase (prepilin peptidase)/N-methyltransferase